jgi:methionyl aminopeptidase
MIILKSEREIALMREACKILSATLSALKDIVKPRVTTKELDKFADEFIRKRHAVPAFKGYRGYPASLCASINEVVIHGIPSNIRLKEGDIIGLDIGVLYKGYHGDAAITVPVGEIDAEKEKLLKVTEEALYRGINEARQGNRLYDISHAIQEWVEKNGFSVVREFVGHGIGKSLHEDPPIPNFGTKGKGPRLRKGMTLAIEPMVNAGTRKVKILKDKWTAVTSDGKPSCHFEHSIAITDSYPEILTQIQ